MRTTLLGGGLIAGLFMISAAISQPTIAPAPTAIAAAGLVPPRPTSLVASPAIKPPPVPPFLAPYVKGDTLELGDLGWLRGDFADATPEQKAQMAQAESWAKMCLSSAVAATRVTLMGLGIKEATLGEMTNVMPPLCAAYTGRPRVPPGVSFDQFKADFEKAQLLANVYLFAVKTGQASNGTFIWNPNAPNPLGDALIARPLAEQMLRRASVWGRGNARDAPPLDPQVQQLMINRLNNAAGAEDRANTEWLKQAIARYGWPRASEVTERAAGEAWLMAQHADQDPVFQLQALRLMEPLVATKDVRPDNYAYLYDRVMLKLTGKQRFGTQWDACRNGVRPLRPVEDMAALPRLRADHGMPTMEEYSAMMDRSGGPCPKG